MGLIQAPIPVLQAYVETVWASDPCSSAATGREHVLPCGQMHLAVRLDGVPLRLYSDANDATGELVGDAVVAGARAGYYIKDASSPARSVGVQLRPGAAQALFGLSATAFLGRHVSLDDVWGRDAEQLRERLRAADSRQARLDSLQSMLATRLQATRPQATRAMHPAVADALVRMERETGIGTLAHARGTSHRHFIALFSDATGLSPKRYARVLRFRRLLQAFAKLPAQPWIDLALAAGYSDQSHCIREFREFTGVTPRVYRRDSGARPHHLPVPAAG